MSKKDKKVDAYIAKSQDFAKPVLKYLRKVVHKGCPEVEEVMKWSFPNFVYKGGILCNMAGFKNHCTFGFWKASLLKEKKIFTYSDEKAMGQFGKITGLSDLPSEKVLIKLVREAAKFNEQGIKPIIKKKPAVKRELMVPSYFIKELNKNKKAKKAFNGFSYSHKKEYVEWITEAKTEGTRIKRMMTAIEWLSEGKPRNWKYMKK